MLNQGHNSHQSLPSGMVGTYIGKISHSSEMAAALRDIRWCKPNDSVGSAAPLTDVERTQLAAAVALSKDVVRVGPLVGFDRGLSSSHQTWKKENFFSGLSIAMEGAPNAFLINISDEPIEIDLQRNRSEANPSTFCTLEMGDALIFPINHVEFRLRGLGEFALVRGFFVGTAIDCSITGGPFA